MGIITSDIRNYRFHGVGQFLSSLIAQAENGEMKLYGRTHDDAADGEDECEWEQGQGYLYCTDVTGMELIYNNFSGGENIVLVLEPTVDDPQEWSPRNADRRECLIRVEEYRVVGAIKAVAFDEDGEVLEEEEISLADLLSENF